MSYIQSPLSRDKQKGNLGERVVGTLSSQISAKEWSGRLGTWYRATTRSPLARVNGYGGSLCLSPTGFLDEGSSPKSLDISGMIGTRTRLE